MKYTSINKVSDFEFHDAMFDYLCLKNGDLAVSAICLNIHSTAKQNPFNEDMEIKEAKITFKGFSPTSYTKIKNYVQCEDGAFRPSEYITLRDSEAFDSLMKDITHGITVYYFEKTKEKDYEYYIEACGNEPYFTATFKSDDVIIEWDEYLKKAWYEDPKWKK